MSPYFEAEFDGEVPEYPELGEAGRVLRHVGLEGGM